MFEMLFGNKNVEKILLFLFVNGKCYGAQLQRMLNTALTPIQKALTRLEKGYLVCSYYEGKMRLYHFNREFPLLPELEQMLKKIYMLLPPDEKKRYYAGYEKRASSNFGKGLKTLLEFWGKLASVKQLAFSAHSKSQESSGWNGRGSGRVTVTKKGANTLLFHEKGLWKGKDQQEMNFTNIFRWTLDQLSGVISLEHLRYGPNRPVFLFHLAPSTLSSLSSIDSHLCDEDTYFGRVHFDRYSLKLTWRVIGTKKNEEIKCCYL